MARQLEVINASGELVSIKVGGAGAEKEVALTEDITTVNAAIALKADAADLTNVDNTADADKPVSTATQTALDLKLNVADYDEKPIGYLYDKAATQDFTTAYAHIDAYTNEYSLNMTTAKLTGFLTPAGVGSYRVTVNCTITVPIDAANVRTISLQIYDVDDSVELALTTFNIAKSATQASRSFGKLIFPTAGNDLVLRVKSTHNITGVVFDDISLDLELLNTTV